MLFFATLSLLSFNVYGGEHQGQKSKSGIAASAADPGKTPVFPSMLPPGKKVPIDNDHYIIYGFDKKPKLGTVIMKVEIYTRDGKKDTSFEVLADSGMPSMKGAHETGEQPLQVSKKGVYLLPVNIVMPGDWEIRITIKKDGKVIFRGSHQFDV
jgi:hypothetical protein